MEGNGEVDAGVGHHAPGGSARRARRRGLRARIGLRRPSVKRLFEDLAGRTDRRLVQELVGQVDAATSGVRLAHDMVRGTVGADEAREQMSAIEHRGDDRRAALVESLASTLTTPIDREDLFRVSRSIDDVLDEVRDFVRESGLYDVRLQVPVAPLLAEIERSLGLLSVAVRRVVRPAEVPYAALQAKKSGNRIRQLYQLALADLFQQQLDMEVFKHRELLRRIDVVGMQVGEAADVLADGAMKRSH